ncbi:uncharacterized protein LOC110922286 isoform X2 [Helianthus annuus]|uniref:uncharacterized protein LOC110922286 isoform X2 n=1 Tax=Helianthus annuus TaxID=4232 RepID=UPI001652BA66|nr:uncharacterized protein LOC110922286 isoform X2 [Helianthus annuus]
MKLGNCTLINERYLDLQKNKKSQISKKKDTERFVSREEGIALAKELKCLFLECSARTRENVHQCFEELALKSTKRAGWVKRDIVGPESIVDYMYRMGLMALIANDTPGVNETTIYHMCKLGGGPRSA